MGLGYVFRVDELNKGEDNDLIARWESEIIELQDEIEALSAILDELSAEEQRLAEKLEEAEKRLAECQNAHKSED